MPTLLIVDDNEMNRDMLARRLMRKGFTILFAPDGHSGLIAARTYHPDLILMDMSLPDMTGSDAAHILKTDRHTCEIPIIALTADATPGARVAAAAARCDDFETKPIEFIQLLGKIEPLLHGSAKSSGTL